MIFFQEASEQSKALGWNWDFKFLEELLKESNVTHVSPDDLDAILCVVNGRLQEHAALSKAEERIKKLQSEIDLFRLQGGYQLLEESTGGYRVWINYGKQIGYIRDMPDGKTRASFSFREGEEVLGDYDTPEEAVNALKGSKHNA